MVVRTMGANVQRQQLQIAHIISNLLLVVGLSELHTQQQTKLIGDEAVTTELGSATLSCGFSPFTREPTDD
jgi:hypothetical protein